MEFILPEHIKKKVEFRTPGQLNSGDIEFARLEDKYILTTVYYSKSNMDPSPITENDNIHQILCTWCAKISKQFYLKYNHLRQLNEKIYLVFCEDLKDAYQKIFININKFVNWVIQGEKKVDTPIFLNGLCTHVMIWHLNNDLLFEYPEQLAALYDKGFEFKESNPSYNVHTVNNELLCIQFENVDMPIMFIHKYVCYILRVIFIGATQKNGRWQIHAKTELHQLVKNNDLDNPRMCLKYIEKSDYPQYISTSIEQALQHNNGTQ